MPWKSIERVLLFLFPYEDCFTNLNQCGVRVKPVAGVNCIMKDAQET